MIADVFLPFILIAILKIQRARDESYRWRESASIYTKWGYRKAFAEITVDVNSVYARAEARSYPLQVSKVRIRHALATEHRARRGRTVGFWLYYLASFATYYLMTQVQTRIDRNLTPKGDRITDPFKIYSGPVFAIQVGGFICAITLLVAAAWNLKRRRKIDSEFSVIWWSINTLRSAARGDRSTRAPFELDQDVSVLCTRLKTYALYGHPTSPAIRRDQISIHISQIVATLEDATHAILRDGDSARTKLISALVKLTERSVMGRWHGLLDEGDLSERARSMTADASLRRNEKKEFRLSVAGVLLALCFAVGAALLNMPTPVILAVAAVTTIVPAAIGGRGSSMSPANLLSQARHSLTPTQSDAQSGNQ
ncbi:hypothetical protein [Streptomyces coelicoflavus]|uniref:hypothetical protein n=1 Tax=Streptomyces coelicoflavus TaxID=285562 RepID=UPI003F49CD51